MNKKISRGVALVLVMALCLLLGDFASEQGASASSAGKPIPPFAFLSETETVQQMMDRINAQTTYTPGYLTNGKPITMENIEEMIQGVTVSMPAGTTWDNSTKYSYKPTGYPFSKTYGCISFATALSDYLFGKDAPVYTHQNFDDVKPGDIVCMKNYKGYGSPNNSGESTHSVFVIGQGPLSGCPDEYGRYYIIDANPTVGSPLIKRLGHSNGSNWSDKYKANSVVFSRYTSITNTQGTGNQTATPASPITFSDVPSNHWAASAIAQASSRGWINGLGDGRFNPEGQVTYAEFAAMLTRAFFKEDLNAAGTTNPWYLAPCQVADSFGHYLFTYTAYTDPKMAARTSISRTDMAHMLSATVEVCDMSKKHAGMDLENVETIIPDFNQYNYHEQQSISDMYALGLMNGYDSSGVFAGSRPMTRAQAATVLIRTANLLGF